MRKVTKKLGIYLIILSMFFGIFATGCVKTEKKYGDVKGLFWEVKKGNATVYMLGSIHLGDKSLFPMQKAIEDAYESSNIVVGEIDMTNTTEISALTQNAIYYSNGDTAMNHLSPQGIEKVDKLCSELGLKREDLQNLRLWELGSTLSMAIAEKVGYDPGYGIDIHFLNRSKYDGKKIEELEGTKFQLDLLNSFSDKEQEDNFILNLTDTADSKKYLDSLFGLYKSGDEEKIIKFLSADEDKNSNYYKELVANRNIGMTNKIEEYLNTKNTYFVIAGAAHFIGDDGIIKKLEDKGYTVTRK